ncbi:MAG: SDR family oxidoreductase [Flavobacteriales bacterium]|jgi:NADP-dependent 3-hydroxy acid dehydrogenase YdfG
MKKHVLITGASSGIGRAIARRLYAEGYSVTLFARNRQALEKLAAELGPETLVAAGDVCDYDTIRSAVRESIQRFGALHALINNAGIGRFDPLQEGKIEHWHEMVDVNVKGVLNAFHAALPALTESRGHVVNIGSVASHLVFPNSGIYCATKHAVLAISQSIGLELSGKIGITTISPGSVNTPFIEQTQNSKLLAELRPGFAAGLAPETIADQVAFALAHSGKAIINEILIRPDKRT